MPGDESKILLNSAITRLSEVELAVVLQFLHFRDICVRLRAVNRAFAAAAASSTSWLVRRLNAGITPILVEDGPEASVETGPQLYRASPQGALVASVIRCSLLPVQVAWLAYSCVNSCEHLPDHVIDNFVATVISSGFRGLEDGRCVDCSGPGDFVCIRCGAVMCSNSKNGCMQRHAEAKKSANDAGHDVGLSFQAPPGASWCYGCQRPARCGQGRALTPRRVRALVRANPERPLLTTSLVEHQIMQACRCPHLDERMVARFELLWERHRHQIIRVNCCAGTYQPPELRVTAFDAEMTSPSIGAVGGTTCQSRNTYLCLCCAAPLCGTFTGGHAHAHSLASGHLVTFGTRTLNTYCFGCCRHLGMGDDLEEYRLTKRMRDRVCRDRMIAHHHDTLWDEFDRAMSDADAA